MAAKATTSRAERCPGLVEQAHQSVGGDGPREAGEVADGEVTGRILEDHPPALERAEQTGPDAFTSSYCLHTAPVISQRAV